MCNARACPGKYGLMYPFRTSLAPSIERADATVLLPREAVAQTQDERLRADLDPLLGNGQREPRLIRAPVVTGDLGRSGRRLAGLGVTVWRALCATASRGRSSARLNIAVPLRSCVVMPRVTRLLRRWFYRAA
jgi:hypothetical protein